MTGNVVIVEAGAQGVAVKGDEGCPTAHPTGVKITLDHRDSSIEMISLGRRHAITIADAGTDSRRVRHYDQELR